MCPVPTTVLAPFPYRRNRVHIGYTKKRSSIEHHISGLHLQHQTEVLMMSDGDFLSKTSSSAKWPCRGLSLVYSRYKIYSKVAVSSSRTLSIGPLSVHLKRQRAESHFSPSTDIGSAIQEHFSVCKISRTRKRVRSKAAVSPTRTLSFRHPLQYNSKVTVPTARALSVHQ